MADQKIRCVCCGGVFPKPQKGEVSKDRPTMFRVYAIDENRQLSTPAVYMCFPCQEKHNAIPRVLTPETILLDAKNSDNPFTIATTELPAFGRSK